MSLEKQLGVISSRALYTIVSSVVSIITVNITKHAFCPVLLGNQYALAVSGWGVISTFNR